MAQPLNAVHGTCGCDGPGTASAAHCCCGVRDLTHVVGRRHAMAIVNRIGRNPGIHFSDLQRELEIGPSTLADTLQELEQVQLISRQVLPDKPPRSAYHLTAGGTALRSRLRPFLEYVRGLNK